MSIVGFSKTFEFKIQVLAPGSPQRFATEKFFDLVNEKLVNEKSEHKIKVKYFLEGEIIRSAETIEALKVGMLDMSTLSPSYAASLDKRLNLFEVPFLWTNYEHFQNYVVEAGGGEKLGQILIDKAGVRPLFWYSTGFRWMYFKDKINSLEDLKKAKMRTPPGKVYLDLMKIIGINAITVPWSETFVSLNTGLVNAVECPPSLAYTARFHEVINYAWPSKHMLGVNFFLINENLWQSLPEDLKDTMTEAAYETSYYMYGITAMLSQKAIKNMKEETGVEVIYDVNPAPLANLFVDYQLNFAKENDLVDMMEEILKMK